MAYERELDIRTRAAVECQVPPEDVYAVVSDLSNHLVWSGDRASDDYFKLLSLDAPPGPATAGMTFTSVGANFNGTFHDRSVVTEASPPNLFVIETDARLDRKRGRAWEVFFTHRYDIAPADGGSRITYSQTISKVSYVPYWLQPWAVPIFRAIVNRADRKQLGNLARLAEERSG
jgi:hypothetical protein